MTMEEIVEHTKVAERERAARVCEAAARRFVTFPGTGAWMADQFKAAAAAIRAPD
jgi:hypothetical protein